MKIHEIINEGTEIFVNGDDDPFAKRSARGGGKGPAIRMLVTPEQWEQIKKLPANTEMGEYDIASAEGIIDDMVASGGEVIWKTAAEWNKDAREMEDHRFRNDPQTRGHFDNMIGHAKGQAKDTTRSSMKVVK